MDFSKHMQSGSLPKIAFVTPWYGVDIPGGAEALTRTTAEHLRQAGIEVEVWTTTIRDVHSDFGKNHHRPGLERVNGVPVRRFPVEKRDRAAFDAINWRLMQNLPVGPEDEQVFIREMFRAPALYHYIGQEGQDFLLFFVAYMFASTYHGAQIFPERSAIVPCLHDEAYARLSIYRAVLRGVRSLIFNSTAEQELARKLYGETNGQLSQVIGMGIEANVSGEAARFRQKFGLHDPFVLYVGRREPGKNTPLLLDYWQQYVQEYGRDVKLVLIGPGDVQIPPALSAHVVDLGFVAAQDKLDAYAAASVLCQPSVNESFSIVLLESWHAGTPVLVHGACAVTVEHCRQSNGGLYFTDGDEFAATLNYLLDHPTARRKMGAQGKRYVTDNFHWDVVIEKYRTLMQQMEIGAAEPSISTVEHE